MNLSLRTKLVMLSGAPALGGLPAAAPAAHAAPPPQIYAIGGPGEVTIFSNNGFTNGATVRLEVLTPGFAKVLDTEYFTVDQCGGLTGWPNPSASCPSLWPNAQHYVHINVYPYVGDVQVMADQFPGVTVGAQTRVGPMPTVDATTGFSCKLLPVNVSGSNFQPTATVRLELLDASWHVMDT